jgi:hypothetical protein
MGSMKNYLLTLLQQCSEEKTGQDAVENAVFTGTLHLCPRRCPNPATGSGGLSPAPGGCASACTNSSLVLAALQSRTQSDRRTMGSSAGCLTCNRRHESLDDLEQTLTTALRPFWETPARVLSLIHHWLRAQANVTP